MELSSTGRLTVVDRRRNKRVETVVPAAELARVTSVVVQAQPKTVVRNSMCSDCFRYSVTARVDARKFSADLDDTTLSASGLAALVKTLIELQDRALAAQPVPFAR